MKTCLDKAIVLALAAAIYCAPGGLSAEDEKSEGCNYFGIKGGLSLLPDAAVGEVYPGVYPNKPVFGVFLESRFSGDYWGWLEILYLDQSSVYDVLRRDGGGNIVAEYNVNCSRKYLEFILGGKLRAKTRTVTPFVMTGGAMSVLLDTSRKPDIVDPEQPKFRGPAFSAVIGMGIDAAVGGLLLSIDVRFDFLAERAFSDRVTPKPDALLFMAGIGF